MEDNNKKSSKKHTASESDGSANIGDDNPSRLKRARRTFEGGTAATATTTPEPDRDHGPVLNRCVLLSTEQINVPPPPSSKPPKQTSARKCVFIGPCENERTAFIQSFVHRGSDNSQKKLASSSPSNYSTMVDPPPPSSSSSVWSIDYSKKEYSYQNPQGDSSTVLLQFYNVGCKIDAHQLNSEKQQPPSIWKSLCSSFDHVVLVLSMPEQLTEDSAKHLTRTIETWKAWMDSQCAPRCSGYPISLLLTTTASTTTVEKNNSSGVASTSIHPAMILIRFGAALEISRQKYGFLNWYLWALNNNKNNTGKVMDSMDEIIQILVESTKAVMSPSVATTPKSSTVATSSTPSRRLPAATPPSSRRSTDSTKDVTAAAASSTAAKTPTNSSGESPGPDTPLPSRANGASP